MVLSVIDVAVGGLAVETVGTAGVGCEGRSGLTTSWTLWMTALCGVHHIIMSPLAPPLRMFDKAFAL